MGAVGLVLNLKTLKWGKKPTLRNKYLEMCMLQEVLLDSSFIKRT